MNMEKKISNITLPFIVLLLGVIFLGMIGIGEDDVSMNYSDADSITSRNTGSYNIGPYGEGVFLQKPPFVFTGGTTPSGMNSQAGNSYQQYRIPAEGVWMGMEIEGLSPGTIRELGLRKNQTGVILDSVPPGSDADKVGLRNGDIIRAINGQIIVNMADYIRATKNQKLNSAILEIERNGQILTFTIPPQPTVRTGMTGSWPGVNNTSSNVDAYTRASPKFTRIINKKGIPPITLYSPLPHDYVGVCARCHEIARGEFHLIFLMFRQIHRQEQHIKAIIHFPIPLSRMPLTKF